MDRHRKGTIETEDPRGQSRERGGTEDRDRHGGTREAQRIREMREDEHEERQRERQRNARRNVWRQIGRGCELGQQGWSWGTDRCLWSGSGRSSAFREKKSHLARGPQVQGPDNGSQMSVGSRITGSAFKFRCWAHPQSDPLVMGDLESTSAAGSPGESVVGSHQGVRRSQGWAPLPLLPPLSPRLSPLLPCLPTPRGWPGWADPGLGGL